MNIEKAIKQLNKLYPESHQYDWDNSGTQLLCGGDTDKALLSLDFSTDVVEEAKSLGANLVITHHPLFFKGLKQLRYDKPVGAAAQAAIKADISLYSMHTNFDNDPAGMGELTCRALGCQETRIMRSLGAEPLAKLTTFVPTTHTNEVAQALGDAGAGGIGDYSHCSFRGQGQGNFKPLDGANPHSGTVGELATTNEDRLEMIIPLKKQGQLISILRQVHPYEEVAFDIIALQNKGASYGIGTIGSFADKVNADDFLNTNQMFFNAPPEKIYGTLPNKIKKIGFVGGVGTDFIRDAVRARCDVYLTGEVRYHDIEIARAAKMPVIQLGHGISERPGFYAAKAAIAKATSLEIHISNNIWEAY